MDLIGRREACARLTSLADEGEGPITVWGPPGVGKSALVRHVLPDWRSVDGRAPVLGTEPFVVWDGITPQRARDALRERRRVVLTSWGPSRVAAERCVELGPLALGDSRALLEEGLRRLGRHATASELHTMAVAADGLPQVLQASIAAFDLLGAEALSVRETGWRARACACPHLSAFTSRLDQSWALLDEEARGALRDLAMVAGPIRIDLAVSMLGPDAAVLLRRLRDGGWLHVVRPGTLRILGPMRSYLLRTHPPTDAGTQRLVTWAFEQAKSVPKPLDSRCRALVGEYTADLREAAERGANRPGLPEVLSVLSVLSPSTALLPLVEAGLRREPGDADLLQARLRVLTAARKEDEVRRLCSDELPRTYAQSAIVASRLASMAHSHRRLGEARTHYLRALKYAQACGDDEIVAATLGNLGMIAQNAGDLDEAMEHYARALAVWRNLGGRRQAGLLRSNLALMLVSRGRLDEARWQLARAREIIEAEGVPVDQAVVRANLGMLSFLEQVPAEADHHLRYALDLIEGRAYPAMRCAFLALLAANTALLGDASTAKRLLRRADAAAAECPVVWGAFVDLHRGFVDLAEGRRVEAGVRLAAARRANGRPALVEVMHDARLVAGVLEDKLLTAGGPALYVAEDGSWFRLSDALPVSLGQSPILRRLLCALASAPADGEPAELDDRVLVAAAWPDDPSSDRVLRKRLRVAMSKLRTAGLREVIRRGDIGYGLAAELPVLWVSNADFRG